MKILEMSIYNNSEEKIRNIEFKETGINFIYGDVSEPESDKGTINSIGKTTLLKCIDYIFGSKESSKFIGEEIKGYILRAKVLYNNETFFIQRIIGQSIMKVNGDNYGLESYKEKFKIERKYYNKQIILEPKGNFLGYNKYTSKDDVELFLEMLGFDELSKNFAQVTNNQKEIKDLKNNKKNLISFLEGISENDVDQEIFFINQKIKKYEENLEKLLIKLDDLDINDEQNKILQEYESLNIKFKELKYEKLKLGTEIKNMQNFMEESSNLDITANHIISLYEKAKQEVPEMVKVKLSEVEEFHQKMYVDRKIFLKDQLVKKNKELEDLDKSLYGINLKLKELSEIISVSEAYKEAIKLTEKYNDKLKDLKYQQGRLSQIEQIEEEIKLKDEKLSLQFLEVAESLSIERENIEKIKEYINSFVKKIYGEEVYAFFNIDSVRKHQAYKPVKVKLELRGEDGEGIGEVKKIIMDYVIFKFNSYINIIIHDSSCYNGIDNRQIVNMLKELNTIALEEEKQAIVTINKYQVYVEGDRTNKIHEFIKENTILELNEKEKLFKIDY